MQAGHTPKGLYIKARGQRSATLGKRTRKNHTLKGLHKNPTTHGRLTIGKSIPHMKQAHGILNLVGTLFIQPFQGMELRGFATQGGAALTLGFDMEPLRGRFGSARM